MDSLTQIVLGAACGEAILGKKIGNKALLFGAIGGTIPDLDVPLGRLFYTNEIDINAFHRGFMHSIVFSIIGAFVFGALLYWIYNRGRRLNSTTRKNWIWMFFLALFTHIFLDSFTPYGTQFFLPFSDFRVAFNNISVVDIIYTVPFLICMIVLMFFNRKNKRRRTWLKAGLYISSSYLLLTIANKLYMDSVFERSLKTDNITYTRFRIQPTIFNNILWYGIAESENKYVAGYYSLLDKSSRVTEWVELPKNHDLVPLDHEDIKTMTWFSDNYFNIMPNTDGREEFLYNDLRYPLFNSKDPNSSVFSLKLFTEGDRWNIRQDFSQGPSKDDFDAFIERLKGI